MNGRDSLRGRLGALWSGAAARLRGLPSGLLARRVVVVLAVTFALLVGRLASTRVSWVVLAVAVLAVGLALMGWGLAGKLADPLMTDREKRTVRGEFAVDAGIALTTGAVVGVALLLATWNLEENLASQQAQRDDVRFVREVATQAETTRKPFDELDLREAQLGGLDLSNAQLSGTILVDAELRAAILENAVLRDAQLAGADLSDARLHNADLTGADLSGADLSNADLDPVYLSHADLRGANLSGATLTGSDLTGANLSGADLSNADLSGVDLSGVSLHGADLRRADLSDAFVTEPADFSDANFRRADLSNGDFYGVDLSGADMTGAQHRGLNARRSISDEDTVWPDDFEPPRSRQPRDRGLDE